MLRRRLMIAQAGTNPPPASGIVTDGLVFRLNGLNQGGVSGHWIDEIGGIEFAPNSEATMTSNGIRSKGRGGVATASRNIILHPSGTLEVAGKAVDYFQGFTIISPTLDTAQFMLAPYTATKLIIGNKLANLKMYTLKKRMDSFTISVSDSLGYMNLERLEREPSSDWYTTKTRKTLALFGDGYPGAMTGDIFEVRYYDRKLTEAEILQNQQYDIDTYFGGGL